MLTMDRQNQERMDQITAGLPSKSEKMRRLSDAGFAKADIARYLGVRYQFVYNVLSAPLARPKGKGDIEEVGSNADEVSQAHGNRDAETSANWVWTSIDKQGRIALPAAFRQALGLGEGDDVQLQLTDDGVRVLGRAAALRALQEDVRRYVPRGVSLVDELIAERRAEVEREYAGG